MLTGHHCLLVRGVLPGRLPPLQRRVPSLAHVFSARRARTELGLIPGKCMACVHENCSLSEGLCCSPSAPVLLGSASPSEPPQSSAERCCWSQSWNRAGFASLATLSTGQHGGIYRWIFLAEQMRQIVCFEPCYQTVALDANCPSPSPFQGRGTAALQPALPLLPSAPRCCGSWHQCLCGIKGFLALL